MFSVVKDQVDFIKVAEELLGEPLEQNGSVNWEPVSKTCPFCHHKDCFKLNAQTKTFKCFSAACDEDSQGDIFQLALKLKGLNSAGEALQEVARIGGFKLPARKGNAVQDIFNVAAKYYHDAYLTTGPIAVLGGKSPAQYQAEVRKHDPKVLELNQIGWTDGKLVRTLESLGYDPEDIKKTSLVNRAGKDFFPAGVFIYPHFVSGQVSHFTLKDPLKQVKIQTPSAASLNNKTWYNSDSLSLPGPVLMVEGENDVFAILSAGWGGPVIATIGTLSKAQVEAFERDLKGRDVITIYDADDAGDGYRAKTKANQEFFKSLTQVRTEGVKDVDEYLKAGGNLKALLESNPIEPPTFTSSQIKIVNGGYYKTTYKDGKPIDVRLSNFTVELVRVYTIGDTRERLIRLHRCDGYVSAVYHATSESKISLKAFKLLAANAADGAFYGSELDLIDVWDFIYSRGREKIVKVSDHCGKVNELGGGWLFANMFIPENGGPTLFADENGVVWPEEDRGLTVWGIEENSNRSVPHLEVSTQEESDELLKQYLFHFSNNFARDGSRLGDILTIAAFGWACAFSDEIFQITKSFPLLYFWGQKSGGKSVILEWARMFYGMPKVAASSMSGTSTQVGWTRLMSYYSSLPLLMDEMRGMSSNMEDIQNNIRNYFDRKSRVVGSRDSRNNVASTPVRSTLILGGEDIFSDPATLQRCLPIHIPKDNKVERDMDTAYRALEALKPSMVKVGYTWITTKKEVFAEESLDEALHRFKQNFAGKPVESRTAFVWSVVGVFAEKLAAQFYPEFDYAQYAVANAINDRIAQDDVGMVQRFFTVLARLQVTHPRETSQDFIAVEGNQLSLWLEPLHSLFLSETKFNTSVSKFTYRAVESALAETPFFIGSFRRKFGPGKTQRTIKVFDLEKAPDFVKQLAEYINTSL